MSMRGRILQLLETLPAPTDMESGARSALRPLLEEALSTSSGAPLQVGAGTCPNCGAVAPSARTPYCSDACKSFAAFVRQFRVALESNYPNEDRLMMFGQTFWFLIGGGRPLRVSIAPPSAIKQVFKRTDGKCESCGAPATTIDNVGSG